MTLVGRQQRLGRIFSGRLLWFHRLRVAEIVHWIIFGLDLRKAIIVVTKVVVTPIRIAGGIHVVVVSLDFTGVLVVLVCKDGRKFFVILGVGIET